ncbi:hypothetical protein niasHT_019678 [Heterodera trifolii]|uniref:Uncharacterized protein n=1 Tax=Heterodera trifolii TaxID=157864 RepID=A0ABD2LJ97_9BILA
MSNQNCSNSQSGENEIGSDFDPVFFTAEENVNFENLLNRMRLFESAVCRQFRRLEYELAEINGMFQRPNENLRVEKLEQSMADLEDREELDHFQMEEKVIKIEGRIDTVGLNLKSLEKFTKVRFNKIVEKMKSEMAKMTEDIDILRKRIEFLEMEGASDENLWAENGHSFEHEQFLNEDPPNSGENCEIMISDPFLGGIAPLESYDGNPSISFSRWSSKFEDMLSLYPQLTEAQKLSRLRILLIDKPAPSWNQWNRNRKT